MSKIDPETVLPLNYPAYPPWKYVLPMPSEELMYSVGARSLENFLVVGDAWSQIISRSLPHAGKILDIGCGCGRVARYLVALRDLRYVGFDIYKPSIEWCRAAFEPIHGSRFTFVHFDGYSRTYNPRGRIRPTEYSFPCPTGSMDYAFAASVFTHLLEPHARHYLRETARVLVAGGRALLSIHDEPPAGQRFAGTEDRIDIEDAYFIELAAESGLRLTEHLGDVCGQQMFLFTRS